MPKVLMRKGAASPTFNLKAGKAYTLDSNTATLLFNAGACDYLTPEAIQELPKRQRPQFPGSPDPGDDYNGVKPKITDAPPVNLEDIDDDEIVVKEDDE